MREEYDFLQDRNNELEHENSMLHEQVTELQDENMSLMDKCETLESGLPHPCTFDGKRHVSEYTLKDWLNKLKEEVAEVEAEVDKLGDLSTMDVIEMNNAEKENEFEHLTEELLDVITVSTSVLDWLGWSVYGRLQKQKGVNEKNRKRGYWNE
jgi:predicted nuclease with TOPRIM domain